MAAPRLSDEEIVKVIDSYFKESEDFRKKRFDINKRNIEAYLSQCQDEPEETGLRSSEFIPRTFVAVERLAKFITKALSDVGDKFFTLDFSPDSLATQRIGLDPESSRSFMHVLLSQVSEEGGSFFEVLEDAIKYGLLAGEMIAKVYGLVDRKIIHIPIPLEKPNEQTTEARYFTPKVKVIHPNDFYPDPTGRGLYEIRKFETDYHILAEMAEDGFFYNKEKLEKAVWGGGKDGPLGRKKVEVTEFYGDIVGYGGSVAYYKSFISIANGKMISDVLPNPFWHGLSPFVRVPFTRSPNGEPVAIFDSVVDVNIAMNRLFNLMLDGAVGSVKGVKLVRTGFLENPAQIMGGVQDGDEIYIRADVPYGAKPIDFQKFGEIPPEAFNMFAVLDRILTEAGLLTDIAVGRPPPKEATATEIVQLMQSQSFLLNGLILAIERFISEVIKRVWMLAMQYLEFMNPADIIATLGLDKADKISQLTPQERYEMFSGASFRVTGLSEFIRRSQDLQAIVGMVSSWLSNPVMAQTFLMRFDMFRILEAWARFSGIDYNSLVYPEHIQRELEQQAALRNLVGGGETPAPPQQQPNVEAVRGTSHKQSTSPAALQASILGGIIGGAISSGAMPNQQPQPPPPPREQRRIQPQPQQQR